MQILFFSFVLAFTVIFTGNKKIKDAKSYHPKNNQCENQKGTKFKLQINSKRYHYTSVHPIIHHSCQ